MKKLVGILAAAVLGSSVFAQVNLSSWNRVNFIPAAYNGNQVVAGEGENWAGTNFTGVTGTTRVFFSGDTKNAGFHMEVFTISSVGGSKLALGDPNYVYAKPFNWMKISLGQLSSDLGRGNVTFGMFDHGWRVSAATGDTCEDTTFSQLAKANYDVVLTPMSNLWIQYAGKVKANDESYHTLYNQAKLAVGYNIPGVGLARVQYLGRENTKDINGDVVKYGVVEAALDLTAVQNLWVTMGVKVPTNFETWTGEGNGSGHTPVKAAIGANYNLYPVVLHALIDTRFVEFSGMSNNKAEFNDFGYAIGLGCDIKLNDKYTVITDLRMRSDVYNRQFAAAADALTTRGDAAAYVGISQSLSNGILDLGFQVAGNGAGPFVTNVADKKYDMTWAIPLQITAWF